MFDCENLRDGCPGLLSADGYPGNYSYIAIDTTRDATSGPGAGLTTTSPGSVCRAPAATRVRLRRPHGQRITRVKVFVDGRLVMTRTGRSLRQITLPGRRGRHRIRIDEYAGARRVARLHRTLTGCGAKR